jgi:hypothetical protein
LTLMVVKVPLMQVEEEAVEVVVLLGKLMHL